MTTAFCFDGIISCVLRSTFAQPSWKNYYATKRQHVMHIHVHFFVIIDRRIHSWTQWHIKTSPKAYLLRNHPYTSKHYPSWRYGRKSITKTRLFKYIEIFTSKNWTFSDKKKTLIFFYISDQNIDCGYSLEPPRRGGSNEYPQSMFLSKNKTNNV